MVSAALIAALALATLAPAAQADRVRYRGHRHGTIVIDRHDDSFGSALFGFIGGFVLGSIVTQNSQVYDRPVAGDFVYYDPYCDREFVSFRDYDRHLARADHPARLMVLDRRGDCVARYERVDGRWVHVDGRYRDDGDGRRGRDDGAWRRGDDRWYGGYRYGDGPDRDEGADD
jgi:hypothetical protein